MSDYPAPHVPGGGACPVGCLPPLPIRHPAGGLPSLPPVAPAVSLPFCPHPPAPLPLRGRGRFLVYFAGGSAPGTPALNRLRHLQSLPSGHPAQGACGCPQKRQEAVPYEQCRQPRRGGTGGEELRRLRWSSPPGQGEPVPRGFSLPPGTTAAGIASAAGGMQSPAAKRNF